MDEISKKTDRAVCWAVENASDYSTSMTHNKVTKEETAYARSSMSNSSMAALR